MEKYIPLDAVLAEIKKLMGNPELIEDWRYRVKMEERNELLKSIINTINTLEVKEVKNIWHIVSETDLPKVGEHICCIKNGNILSGEYRANKFYGKVCDGYDNPIEKGDKWCRLYDLLDTLEVKEVD